jgi:HlyD family secretion protein
MKRTNLFAKRVLPLLALGLIGYAIHHTLAGRPNDTSLAPAIAPATAPIAAADATDRVASSGIVEPAGESVAVAPTASGVVSRVAIAAGDRVAKGQLLFALDDRELMAESALRQDMVTTQERNLEVALAELDDKTALLRLIEDVAAAGFVSREELLRRQGAVATANARVSSARAQIAEARSALKRVRTQLDLLAVKAPLDATVLQVRIRPGEFAATGRGEAPITLGKTSPLHVRLDIDEADVPRLKLPTDAWVAARGSGDRRVSAAFVRVEPLLAPKRSLTNAADERVDTRVLQVVVALPTDATGFFVGQQVDAFLEPAPSRMAAGAPR